MAVTTFFKIAILILAIENGQCQEEATLTATVWPPTPNETLLTGDNGLFASKDFPEEYPSNTQTKWNITVDEGKKIKLTFHLFNVEHNRNCQWDWVKVFDTNGTLLKAICGYLQQDLILFSTGNSMAVELKADHTVNAAGFLASWEAVPEDQENEDTKPTGEGYVLSFPQTFVTGSELEAGRLCLQMLNLKQDGEVTLSLYAKKEVVTGKAALTKKVEVTAGDKEIHCHSMELPEDFEDQYAIVGIKADISGYKILSFKSVRVLKSSPLGMIQTDKYDYRPKQQVFARVMLMNEELRPSSVERVEEMWVNDANGNRLHQWKNLALNKGLAQVSFNLTEEPDMGKWEVKAKISYGNGSSQEIKAPFEVNEAVLPTFEVTAEAPKVVLKESQEEHVKVCAKYTHGANVKGKANVTVSTRYKSGSHWNAAYVYVNVEKLVEVDGCTEVKLNSTDMKKLTEKSTDLSFKVTVKEEVSKEVQEKTIDNVSVQDVAFKIEAGTSPRSHILNAFPYVGDFKVLDHEGHPQKQARLMICARLYTDLGEMRNYVNNKLRNSNAYWLSEEDFYEMSQRMQQIRFAEKCFEQSSDDQGSVSVAVSMDKLSVPTNVTKLSIHLKSMDYLDNAATGMKQPSLKYDVRLTHTNSVSALVLKPESSRLNCNSSMVKVYISGIPGTQIELTTFVASGGNMISSKTENVQLGYENQAKKFIKDALTVEFEPMAETRTDQVTPILVEHEIKITRPFTYESATLEMIKMLSYVRDPLTLQTLSASVDFETEPCSKDASMIEFDKSSLRPGDGFMMKIKGPSGGLCGYSIVDKSVSLIANPNQISKSRVKKLKDALDQLKIVNDKLRGDHCQDASLLFRSFEKLGLFVMSDKLAPETSCDSLVDVTVEILEEENREPVFSANSAIAANYQPNSAQAFEDYDQYSTRFAARPEAAFDGEAPPDLEEVQAPSLDLRSYFPETWLFDLVDLDQDGAFDKALTVPHTITTWIADAFCTSSQSGITFAPQNSVKVDQDFFISMTTPYSIKRGELLTLNVTAFNKLKQRSLPLKIKLANKNGEYRPGKERGRFCLPPGSSETQTLSLKMKTLEDVDVHVEAIIQDHNECDALAGNAAEFKDAIQKSIYVKPEGFPVEKVKSEFICREQGDAASQVDLGALELPANDLVEGSARAWVSVSGDILAPSMDNLDKLVKMPYGCGEQNMISMVPNIYVAKYLEGTEQDKPELLRKAKKYMKAGYERQEERYRHKDGSYSIWGPRDDEDAQGSLWLTSFVVKAFSQAAEFIEVNEPKLLQSMNWLNRRQNRTSGCYQTEGFVIHSSLAQDSEVALTAHLLISASESEKINFGKIPFEREEMDLETRRESSIELAEKCVQEGVKAKDDLYTQALAAYAFALRNMTKESEDLLDAMMKKSKDENGKLYWTEKEDASYINSKDVEITAYNLLTLVKHEMLPEALKVTKWLATQRNSYGGFKSTQDTMIALQGLSEYALRISKEQNDLKIQVKAGDLSKKLDINEDNELLQQKERITFDNSDTVSASVEGSGCFMVQSILKYNVMKSPEESSFELKVEQDSDGQVEVCSKYTGSKDKTNMVVIEIELLSGFEPHQDSLKELMNQKLVKKVEHDEKTNVIALYFNDMPKESKCHNFAVKEASIVQKRKPAIAKIYDYYDQEDVLSTEYIA